MSKTPGLDYMRPDWVLDVRDQERPEPVVAVGIDDDGDMVIMMGDGSEKFLLGDFLSAADSFDYRKTHEWRHLSHLDPHNPRTLQEGDMVKDLSGDQKGVITAWTYRGAPSAAFLDVTQVVRVADLEPLSGEQ